MKLETSQNYHAERAARTAKVKDIQTSAKTMAEKHLTDYLLIGPIPSARCSPLGSGSTKDLAQLAARVECFSASKDKRLPQQ